VRARDLDPGLDGLDFSLGWLYLETDRHEKALLHLDRFLARHPEQPVALLGRARALAALGRSGEVGEAYGRAIERMGRPQPDHYLEWSRTLSDRGDPALALAVLDAGLARLGEIGSLLRAAVDVEAERGELEAAVVRLDRLLDSTSRPEEALLRKAGILERMGRLEDARAALRLALTTLEARPASRRAVSSFQELAVTLAEELDRLERATPPAPTASPER
jgi:tetratricopeptide (TPR) repeat protein